MREQEKKSHTLISLEEFKLLLNLDDRDDELCRFCLAVSTHTIEQYCKRRFLCRKHSERIVYYGDLLLPLQEYPVIKMLSVRVNTHNEKLPQLLESYLYDVIPNCGTYEDIPFYIDLSPTLRRNMNICGFSIVYYAGYSHSDVPADLKAACLELAAWNMNRYKSRKIGVQTMNNEKGARSNGSGFEMSMPENVKVLLEPYKRKTL